MVFMVSSSCWTCRHRQAVEVGSLWVPPPDDPVAVLDGAFLVGGVGPRVVDLRPEDPVKPALVQELASVVGGDAPDDPQGVPPFHAPYG